MNKLRIGSVATMLCATVVHAADDGILVKMQLRESDRDIGSPTLLVARGQPSSLQLQDRYRIELVADERDGKTDLRFKLFVNKGNGLEPAGTPRIIVATGETGSLAWGSEGRSFKLTVTPSKAALPVKS